MATPDILCVGESMALVVPEDGRGLATTERVRLTHAGAEATVARYLVDLGFVTGWLSALGNDPLGDRILTDLTAGGVDTRWVLRRDDAPTGVFFKDPGPTGTRVHYYRAGSAASRLAAADLDRWPLAQARWVHVTGITAALSPTCSGLVDALLQRCAGLHVPVSFDVNYRPALWRDDAGPRLLELAQQAQVALVGLDEAQALWGTATAEEVATLIDHPPLLVVKDSDQEAVEVDRSATGAPAVTRVPARHAVVVEPVGAGDAFAAGYLAALLHGEPAPRRLALGHSLAAWTLAATGDYRPGHGPYAHPIDVEEAASDAR